MDGFSEREVKKLGYWAHLAGGNPVGVTMADGRIFTVLAINLEDVARFQAEGYGIDATEAGSYVLAIAFKEQV
jgi:hypothetical protein